MDIRKWLTSAKPKGGSTKSESTSTTNASKNTTKKKTENTVKKRRIIESDSDEEPVPQKEVTNKTLKNGHAENKHKEKAVKEVSAVDFFGSAPVSRTKKSTDSIKKKSDDVDLHGDQDFELTLKQLDSSTKKIQASREKVTKDEKKIIKEDEKKVDDKKIVKEDKNKVLKEDEKKILKEDKKEKSSTKRKAKMSESPKMEITPHPKKAEEKPVPKASEKNEKPAAKKPRGSGSANYQSYLHREGPRALGSKEIPEGEAECLAGLTFIITGVLESMERDEAKTLVEKYGGKVMTTLSKNTKYMVIGRDAGASKLEKAEKLGTNQIDEDGLLNLIKTLPGKGPSSRKKSLSPKKKSSPKKDSLESSFLEDDDDDLLFLDENLLADASNTKPPVQSVPKKEEVFAARPKEAVPGVEPCMWVDRYRPTTIQDMIGSRNNATKLTKWLQCWQRNRQLGKKPGGGRFGGNDDGSGFKAALLSGSPGVGKTTTAQLVCKEVKYDFVELNASDTRSKKSLQQVVSQLLGNQTLSDCFKDNVGKVSRNHVIIMDEVDGMAGNEDRGGMMELISFIKASKVPIICICNDRNHPKIRSLSNYCFDLRFQKPSVMHIRDHVLKIASKERINVSKEALQDIVVASNQDIRQVLHNVSMWSAKSKNVSSDQTKKDISYGTKHVKMNPFDVLREVFAIGNNPKATIKDKSDLFFHDYSIVPLFVQENYLHVIPTEGRSNKRKHLALLSAAAESMCVGDLIDRQIRSNSSWSLLPTQAIFASVIPGEVLKGQIPHMINFPVWLGKNSNRSKMDRILQELHVHMRMRITGNKTDVALDYLPLLKAALTRPLIQKKQEGIAEVLGVMENYYLLREDFESIIDLSLWPQQTDPRTKIETKVKSAFTRAYNKECTKNPYAVTNVKKKRKATNDDLEEEEQQSESEEDEDLEKDAMIKVKKAATKKSDEASTSKGKKKNPPKQGGKAK